MTSSLLFDCPLAGKIGLPLAVLVLASMVWAQRRQGIATSRIVWLSLLRAGVLLLLVFLAARPVWVQKETVNKSNRSVVLLVDRSESMSLQENARTRYQAALVFAHEQLLPALKAADLQVQPLLFAQEVESADGAKLVGAVPNGKRTNLGGAIARGFASASSPPMAVIALTDGAANEKADNMRALSALSEAHVPFIGIGVGSDTGIRTLSLLQVEAPPVAAPNTEFGITAHLEAVNVEGLPDFELVLTRDGKFLQKKTVPSGKGSRLWLESFHVKEPEQGVYTYQVQLIPPTLSGLTSVATMGTASVRITHERELRVLYVQGSLTWDYKFIALALRDDPTIKLTGLTRTSSKSVFRQNVETAGELLNGFPTTLEEIAPFRVVVLSNLKPTTLTTEQQDLLARFCGELGGGVLMMGGESTFDVSWHGSRLEQLLPVVFASDGGVKGLDRPFQFQPTDEALKSPVFQVSVSGSARDAWTKLPTFTQYGRVDEAKPGAQVWALHQMDEGPKGRRILMASQRYGSGLSAVLTVQNFWRWRLAKDADPQQFDRFWRQLFRFLSESSRQDVAIYLANQELHPQMDVRVVLEKQPSPEDVKSASNSFIVSVVDAQQKLLQERRLELKPSHPVDLTFHAEQAGIYTVSVTDALKKPVSSRSIEIRDVNVEFQDNARNMENLRQWASLSDGLAMKIEDCKDSSELVALIKAKAEQALCGKVTRKPVGVNGLTLAWLLGCLGGGWVLRKKWGLS